MPPNVVSQQSQYTVSLLLPKADKEHTACTYARHYTCHNVMTLFAEISAHTRIPHSLAHAQGGPAGNTISTHVNGRTAEELSRPHRDIITHVTVKSSLRRGQSERSRPGYWPSSTCSGARVPARAAEPQASRGTWSLLHRTCLVL